MAVSVTPLAWFGAGYSTGTHTIIFNTSEAVSNQTLPQLTDAKANATTGNMSQVLFAIDYMAYAAWLAKGSDLQPTNLRMSRSTGGDSSGNITLDFRRSYTLSPGGIFTVVAEP